MVQKIIIHIGDHKTGTTSIQDALVHRKLETPETSLFFPRKAQHNHLADLICTPIQPKALPEKLTRLADEFRESTADVGIISAEAFEGVDPARLNEIIAQYFPEHLGRVQILAYVRPHAKRILSSYAEHLKIGLTTGSLRAFYETSLQERQYIYTPRFEQLRNQFGDNFTLRPMVRSQLKDNDVVQDFLSVILQGGPFSLPPVREKNLSLPVEDLALIREVHLAMASWPTAQKRLLGWSLQTIMKTLNPRGTTNPLQFGRALAHDIEHSYLEDAKALDATFFDGTPMADTLLAETANALDPPQSILAEMHYNADELRSIRLMAAVMAQSPDFDLKKLMHNKNSLRKRLKNPV